MKTDTGPFNALGQSGGRITEAGNHFHVCHPSNDAILGYYKTREEAEAAIALHNAAPDLFAVCKIALELSQPASGLADQLRAAIAKATP